MGRTRIWTEDAIVAAAQLFTDRREFQRCAPNAYCAASRFKILRRVCAHMPKKIKDPGYWTVDRVRSVAKKYEAHDDFKRRDTSVYKYAVRMGVLSDVTAHMSRRSHGTTRCLYVLRSGLSVYVGITKDVDRRIREHAVTGRDEVKKLLSGKHSVYVLAANLGLRQAADLERRLIDRLRASEYVVLNVAPGGSVGGGMERKWTKERILAEARKYQSRTQFSKGNESAYRAAGKYGVLSKACEHMRPRSFSKDEVAAVAQLYTSKQKFYRNHPREYHKALSMGWWDELSKHMERPPHHRKGKKGTWQQLKEAKLRYSIMDASGHSTETYGADKMDIDQAMARFAELTGKGYRAVAKGDNGEPGTILKSFDATAEDVLFVPQIIGG